MLARKAHIYAFLRSLGLGATSEMLMAEQFRLVARQIPILYSVIIINCLFMAALASTQVSAVLAFAFPGAAIPIMLFRIGNWRRLTRRLIAAEDYIGMRKALRVTTIMANVLAAVLAGWSIVILLQVPPDKVAFVPVFTILSMITCAYPPDAGDRLASFSSERIKKCPRLAARAWCLDPSRGDWETRSSRGMEGGTLVTECPCHDRGYRAISLLYG